ncbi:MAG: hypothetical protein AAGJ79_06640 [Verrucomicrobiota bacterium]
MNEDDNELEIRLTGEALGEWPAREEAPEREQQTIEATRRVARMVSDAYAQEEDYRLTDSQRQLLLGGSGAMRSLPKLAPRDRRVFVKAILAGLGVAAALLVLLAVMPAPTSETVEVESPVEWVAPEEVDGVVMRVLILEKPAEEEEELVVAANEGEGDLPGRRVETGTPAETVVVDVTEGEQSPPVSAERRLPFRKLVEALAPLDAALLPELDFEAAVDGLDEIRPVKAEPDRWRLARYDSVPEPDGDGRMLQQLTFHGPVEGVEEPLVAVKFDRNRVSRFRPVDSVQWMDSRDELVISVPASAAFRGGWQLLLEVEPAKASAARPGFPSHVATTVSADLGDVVVAGGEDQAVARLKESGEIQASRSMRKRLAIARFSRWLEARDVPPGELIAEMKEISGKDYEEVERRLVASLRIAGTE